VGMAGGSYLAALQWVAAMEDPPHLRAIAPWIGASSTPEEQSLTGGATALYMLASWMPAMAVDVAGQHCEGRIVSHVAPLSNREPRAPARGGCGVMCLDL